MHSPCIRNTQCVIYTVSLSLPLAFLFAVKLWAFFFGAESRKTLLERQSRDKDDGSYTVTPAHHVRANMKFRQESSTKPKLSASVQAS